MRRSVFVAIVVVLLSACSSGGDATAIVTTAPFASMTTASSKPAFCATYTNFRSEFEAAVTDKDAATRERDSDEVGGVKHLHEAVDRLVNAINALQSGEVPPELSGFVALYDDFKSDAEVLSGGAIMDLERDQRTYHFDPWVATHC
jgi:hypothetical protein